MSAESDVEEQEHPMTEYLYGFRIGPLANFW